MNEHCNNYSCVDRKICKHGCDRTDHEFNVIFFGLGMDSNECPNYSATGMEVIDVDGKLINLSDMIKSCLFSQWWLW